MNRALRCAGGLLLAGLLAATASGQQETPAPPPENSKQTAAPRAPVYKPPRRGAPAARIGGATRGPGDPLPVLHVLAPDHVGLTVHASPVFQWYLSKPAQVRLEYALISDNAVEPLFEHDLGTTRVSGIRQLDLADYGIELQPGIVYQWSVALVPDEQARSGDVVASGRIERIPLTEDLAQRLMNADAREAAGLYAEAGIWYDALTVLSQLIADNPDDSALRGQRASLLQQVGLPAAGLADER